jgi:methionyl aminopeptidase
MVHLKSAEEVQIIKESAQILGKAHGEIAKHVKPGVRTQDLNKLAEIHSGQRRYTIV